MRIKLELHLRKNVLAWNKIDSFYFHEELVLELDWRFLSNHLNWLNSLLLALETSLAWSKTNGNEFFFEEKILLVYANIRPIAPVWALFAYHTGRPVTIRVLSEVDAMKIRKYHRFKRAASPPIRQQPNHTKNTKTQRMLSKLSYHNCILLAITPYRALILLARWQTEPYLSQLALQKTLVVSVY